jgi:serine/threonine-protein kinase
VLSAALERPAAERLDFVRRETRTDPELCRAVEELLSASEAAGSFLESPLDLSTRTWREVSDEAFARIGRKLNPAPDTTRDGELIGAWRIMRELGQGGMARVYLAERAEGGFEQRAALKLLRPDLDGDLVERFLAERQILSDLSHPNIARLLDGGTTADGEPYLVMEAVDGLPITDWCDSERLGVHERIRLFRDVLGAVRHAHVQLIVHRDLKPSNILVTAEGRVKLLDFGIARLLVADAGIEPSHSARLLLTPGYASPEQVRGDRITTSSDAYQLGVLLYRLLTGVHPYEVLAGSPAELLRSILDSRPIPPSQAAATVDQRIAVGRATTPDRLAKELRGDLDAIVLKSLRKAPEERYASIAEFDSDLQRFFERRPVEAASSGRVYRTQKFFARNIWAAPVLAGLVMAFTAYVGVQRAHEHQLESERNVAQVQAARAEAVKAFLIDVFRTADPWSSADPERGRDIRVKDALALGSQRIRSELADQPELQVELLVAIADVYRNLDLAGLGRPLIEEALRIQEGFDASVPARASLLLHLGRTQEAVGSRDSALLAYEGALDLARTLGPPHDTLLAAALTDLGKYESGRDNYQRAELLLLRADSIYALSDAAEKRAEIQTWLGGQVYGFVDRPEDAVRAARAAVDFQVGLRGDDDPRTAWARVELADALDDAGRNDEAIGVYVKALATLDRALGPEHDASLRARSNFAITLEEVGRADVAVAELRRILELRIERSGVWHGEVANALQNLAAILRRTGEDEEAEGLLTRAYRVYQAVLEPGHHLLAFPLLTRSSIELDRDDFMTAERTASEALSILEQAMGSDHSFTAMAECRLGRALLGQNRLGPAERRLGRAYPLIVDSGILQQAYKDECLEAFATLLERTDRGSEARAFKSVTDAETPAAE